MTKRVISMLLILFMLLPLCVTTYASANTPSSKAEVESEVSSCINDMVTGFFASEPGQYDLAEAVAIYNADTECIYYIIPVLRNMQCVATIEVATDGGVVLSDEVELYNAILNITGAEYFLYTTGGITYAELPNEIIELYDMGFDVCANDAFQLSTYADKKAEIIENLNQAKTQIDISAVISQGESINISSTSTVSRGVVPSTETEGCGITNFVTQGDYNICWAACVATIVNYKKGRSLTARNVADAMGHNYHDRLGYPGADVYETKDAVNMYGLSYRAFAGKLTWSNVKTYIQNDYPFIIGLMAIYQDSFGETIVKMHMVTGYGYECSYGDAYTDADQRYVNTWDPNGSHRTLRYNATTYSINGYQWIWYEAVAD